MNRPRLFLSAVSEELRAARQAVAATVRTRGFDPVSQDDFPTGYGELRQWLREQLDSCEGLIQLIGQGYGAEPPTSIRHTAPSPTPSLSSSTPASMERRHESS